MSKEAIYGLIALGVFVVACLVIAIIVSYHKSPFKFPYKEIIIDITGARRPNLADYVDRYLIVDKMDDINNHLVVLNNWKKQSAVKIEKSVFKKKRQKQYEECLDEDKMFVFIFNRTKTRYTQINYVKHPYKVTETENKWYYSYAVLQNRFNKLKEIGFEATISEYNAKEQRALMTKELRDQIAIRDNYTCQMCGKHMPDGVGLHIDHIIPIAKGGKSVPSNLQVLCSKCNGKKSNKVVK